MPDSNGPEVPLVSGLSRRRLLGLAAAAVGLLGEGGRSGGPGLALRRVAGVSTILGRSRPSSASTSRCFGSRLSRGKRGPRAITMRMGHPMERDHHITRVTVVNERDPVPLKGVFKLHPRQRTGAPRLPGERIDEGHSEVAVTAECNLHGAWTSTGAVRVADGAGGLLRPRGPPRPESASTEILPPRLRLPGLVRTGRVRSDEVLEAPGPHAASESHRSGTAGRQVRGRGGAVPPAGD